MEIVRRADADSVNLYSGELVTLNDSTSNKVLHCNGTLNQPLLFWFSQRSPLPPGDYNITIRAKINSTDGGFRVDLSDEEGQDILLSKDFSSIDFVENQWINLTVSFRNMLPLPDFEIKTVLLPQNADLYVDYVEVRQIVPK